MIRSYFFLLICVICWGSNFIFGAILVKVFSPMMLSAIRLLFITLFIALYALIKKKWMPISKKNWLVFILLGLIGTCINQASFYAALQTAHPTTSALILALAPITTSILAFFFLKERLTISFSIGSIIALIGVFFVITNGSQLKFTVGLIWIFITMLSFSISIIIIKKLTESYHSITITLYSNLIGFGGIIPIVLFSNLSYKISAGLCSWILLIITAIIMHGVCTLIWNHQIQLVGAQRASLFLNLEPFVTMLVGFIILKNSVSASQIIGGILIILGVFLSTSYKSRKFSKKRMYSKE